jgi:hypothetical protein
MALSNAPRSRLARESEAPANMLQREAVPPQWDTHPARLHRQLLVQHRPHRRLMSLHMGDDGSERFNGIAQSVVDRGDDRGEQELRHLVVQAVLLFRAFGIGPSDRDRAVVQTNRCTRHGSS